MPLDDAVVFSDNVYGTMGPYVLKFDGDTGSLLESVRVTAPMMGPCRITLLNNSLYVACWNNPASPYASDVGTLRGIFPVDPTTMAVGAIIDVTDIYNSAVAGPMASGPQHLLGINPYLYVAYGVEGGYDSFFINPLNVADRSTFTAGMDELDYIPQSFATDGTNIYQSGSDRVRQYTLDFVTSDNVLTGANTAIALAWSAANSRIYAVCGTATMLKLGWGPDSISTLNLAAVQANVKPFRIRYNSADARLYIPCQNENGIIRWNPASDTGEWLDGFESPIDVVFTSTKIWAVQNGITPLAEVTPV